MRRSAILLSIVAVFLAANVASAYTLVMRDGARVDVGEFYWLAGSSVVWVSTAGERRAVALHRVDLDATAVANGERIASFVERAARRGSALSERAPAPVSNAESTLEAVTITSADLEPYRVERERVQAERRASDPVLPPVGVPASRSADDADAYARENLEWRWRSEARELRGQYDAEQAQIDQLREEIAYRELNPRQFRLSYEYNYGRTPIVVDRNGRFRSSGFLGGNASGYFRADEEFAQLNSRLIDLEIAHRATQSRWDAFVEHARRAGVPPGWLRDE